jgi:hypothetical protein
MKALQRSSLLGRLFLGVGILVSLIGSDSVTAQIMYRYKPEECVRCHAGRVYDLSAAGARHWDIPCSGCHTGHPPDVAKPTVPCVRCHAKAQNEHFETTGCLSCHTNGHMPLKMSFKGAGTDVCLICHGLQGWQLRKYESKHSALDCADCHDVHRQFPSCTRCHIPHKGKIAGGCNFCHKAHMPKLASLPDTVPSEDCGMCHKTAADLLSATTTKHRSMPCSNCHRQKHGMIPSCEDCHGTPHPEIFMVKFPQCSYCHNSAHDINWAVEESVQTEEQMAKKQR